MDDFTQSFGAAFNVALKTIRSSQLSAIEHIALESFVLSAKAPGDAAKYVLQRVSENPECPVEETLRSIRNDMKALALKMNRDDIVAPDIDIALRERENHRCCVTGWHTDVTPTYIVAPSVLNDRDLHLGGYLRPLLEASISSKGIEQLFTLLGASGRENELKNLWLMAPSIRIAFRWGHMRILKSPSVEEDGIHCTMRGEDAWRIERTGPGEMSEAVLGGDDLFYQTPSTMNPDTHPLPAEALLNIHSIISRCFHIYAVEEQIQKGWPTEQEPWKLPRMGRLFLRNILSVLPTLVRLALYKRINRWTEYWDPRQQGSPIKFLPFGICLKEGRESTANEANALLLVEKNTSINAPRLIDHVIINETSGFILETTIFGDRLDEVFYLTTYEEQKQIGRDLAKCIAQIRRIPNKNNYLIANTLGGPVSDHRFNREIWGPFNSIGDFTDRLIQEAECDKHEEALSVLYKKHEICFTHSDLHMSNLIIKNGRLHGIIDWEGAGFKPEYWEFTRMILPYGMPEEMGYTYTYAFPDQYKDEVEAEAFLLRNGPLVL